MDEFFKTKREAETVARRLNSRGVRTRFAPMPIEEDTRPSIQARVARGYCWTLTCVNPEDAAPQTPVRIPGLNA